MACVSPQPVAQVKLGQPQTRCEPLQSQYPPVYRYGTPATCPHVRHSFCVGLQVAETLCVPLMADVHILMELSADLQVGAGGQGGRR